MLIMSDQLGDSVRLVLREQGERIPGTINLASQEVLISP